MRGVVSVTVVVLVALAGCSPVASQGTETITPAPPITTERPSPPGVSVDRIRPSVLVDAHATRLAATNYTLVVERQIRADGATLTTYEHRRRVAAGGDVYAGTYRLAFTNLSTPGAVRSVDYWASGDGFATRDQMAGTVVYRGWSDQGDPIRDIDRSRRLERALAAFPLVVAGRTDEAVVLSGVQPGTATVPSPVPGLEVPHNATLTARVTYEGVVTDWRYAYDARRAGVSVRVVYEGHVTDIGTTTVHRPVWVSRTDGWSGP
jgi:hypothetical protein